MNAIWSEGARVKNNTVHFSNILYDICYKISYGAAESKKKETLLLVILRSLICCN